MATVKSLEERLDDFSEELDTLKIQLAGVTARLDVFVAAASASQAQLATISAQLAAVTTRLDNLTNQLQLTNGRLEVATARLEGLITDHAVAKSKLEAVETRSRETTETVAGLSEFKAKTETTLALLRWIGAFSAAALLGMLGAAWTFTNSVSRLDANFQQQQKSLELQQKTLDEIKRDLADIKAKQK